MSYINKNGTEQYLNKLIEYVKSDRTIIGVIVYGSFVASKESRDIDIALIFDSQVSKREMFKKRIHLLGEFPDYFDIQIFNLLPLGHSKRSTWRRAGLQN